MTYTRDMAIRKIVEMTDERVSKVLIFMAGMEAEHRIHEQQSKEQPHKPPKQTA